LTRAGIRTGILVAPLMPGINDRPDQVAPILEAAAQAGAAYVTGIGLHLRKGVREVFLEWLADQRPDLIERYKVLYSRGAYLPVDERRRLAALVRGPDRPAVMPMRGTESAPAQRPGGADPASARHPPKRAAAEADAEVQIPLF
jgi:hypothetical protein